MHTELANCRGCVSSPSNPVSESSRHKHSKQSIANLLSVPVQESLRTETGDSSGWELLVKTVLSLPLLTFSHPGRRRLLPGASCRLLSRSCGSSCLGQRAASVRAMCNAMDETRHSSGSPHHWQAFLQFCVPSIAKEVHCLLRVFARLTGRERAGTERLVAYRFPPIYVSNWWVNPRCRRRK